MNVSKSTKSDQLWLPGVSNVICIRQMLVAEVKCHSLVKCQRSHVIYSFQESSVFAQKITN